MSTFQTPQFIEEKAKIVGPFTLKQFLFLVAGGGISFGAFYVFNFFFWILITAFVAAISASLAFVKINGQPMEGVILRGLGYLWKPRIYTWKRTGGETVIDTSAIDAISRKRELAALQEKLRGIAAALMAKGPSRGTIRGRQGNEERFQAVRFLTGETRQARRVDYKK